MKKIIIISIAILLLASCEKHTRIRPSGLPETKFYSYDKITGIDIGNNATVHVRISENEQDSLIITVDDNILPFLRVDQSRENIAIRFEHVSFIGRMPELSVTLIVKDLRQFGLSGVTTAYFEDTLICNNLELRLSNSSKLKAGVIKGNNISATLSSSSDFSGQLTVLEKLSVTLSNSSDFSGQFEANTFLAKLSGSSDFSGQVEANTITATLTNSSSFDLVGQCKTFNLTMSGSSTTRGYDMVCDDLTAVFSNSSSGQLTVLKTLSATLSGSSVLRYDGSPLILRESVSGSSTLKKR
jgi:hypothetical protein